MKEWKKILQANTNEKRIGVAVSHKIDIKLKTITRDREEHYI